MELQGMTAAEIDEIIDVFTGMMHAEAMHACDVAAELMVSSSNVVVASPIDSLSAIVSTWNKSVQTKLMPYLKNVFTKAGTTVANPLGVTAETSSEKIMGDVHASLSHYANDLYEAGHLAVMVGWQDGATVMTMADSLEAVPSVKEAKAHSVATTLVTGVVNGGEWEQLLAISSKFGNITLKEWVATHDSHTRPTHWAADGQTVPLEQKFIVGDTLLDFPGDPFGDLDEIINCRCTTKYNSEPVAQNSSPQTSPNALSADSAVDTTEQISASAATNPNWKSSDHPRGKDGRFIKKGVGLPSSVFDGLTALNGGEQFDHMPGAAQSSFIAATADITPKQWSNLTDDQKLTIENAINDAIDAGIPGSSIAQMHLDELSSDEDITVGETDLFDPDTELPGGVPLAGVGAQAQEAADKGFISHQQASDLIDELALGEITEDEAKLKLAGMLSPTPAPSVTPTATGVTAKQAEQQIYDAHDAGLITEDEQSQLLKILDDNSAPLALKKLVQMTEANSAPSTAPITTGSPPKPIKITHGLIHAKHAPGTTIAEDEKGNRVVWNGSSYDVYHKDGDVVAKDVKKSKLYALLNDYYGNSQWHEPGGKQETEVSHATPLDAAPAPNPIPHPVSFPAPSAIDTALDDAFGSTNVGLAPASVNEPEVDDVLPPDIDLLLDGEPVSHAAVVAGVNDLTQANWNSLSSGDQAAITNAVDQAYGKTSGAGDAKTKIANFKKSSAVTTPAVPVAAAPQSPSTPAVAQGTSMAGWKQVGGQAGSNKGALFEAPDGKRYYVKSLKSKEHAQNEVLAAALYRAAGINVPEVRHVTDGAPPGWSNVIASPIVPNAKSNKIGLTKPGKFQEQAQQTYAVTAWLANFDAVGLTHDNMIESDGQVHLIDVGGSMGYRAQGQKKKPGDWNEDPSGALSGLMDPNVNPQAASVYGSMTYEQQRESAKALLGITDAQIDQMVKDAGLPPKQAAILKARRDAILKKYGLDKNNTSTSNAPDATMAPTNSPTVTGTPEPDPIAALLDAHANTPIAITPMTTVNTPSATVDEPIALTDIMAENQNIPSGTVIATGLDANDALWTASSSDFDNKIILTSPSGDQFHQTINGLTNHTTAFDIEWTHTTSVDATTVNAPLTTGSSITPDEIISNSNQFAPGEVIATGIDDEGDLWTVSHAPGGYVYMQVAGQDVQTVGYSSFLNQSANNSVNWTASDGSTSLLPGPTPAKKAAKKIAPAKKVVSPDAAQHELMNLLDDDYTPSSGEVVWATNHMTQAQYDKLAPWHKGNLDQHMSDAVSNGAPGAAESAAKLAALKSGFGDNMSSSNPMSPSPAVSVADIPASAKAAFYKHFKDENVSPAWSGAKIYKSMQAAKLKMAGDPQFANLTDEQMLEILDKQHWLSKPGGDGSTNDTPIYSAKVKDWLKTPNGQKAFAEHNPAITTSPSGIIKKAAAKKVTTSSSSTPAASLDSGAGANLTVTQQSNTFNDFKSSAHGKYLKDSPQDIYANAVQIAKKNGISVNQVLDAIDEQGAKNLGVANAGLFKKKITDWHKTPSGQAKAKEIDAGGYTPGGTPAKKTAKKVSAYGGGAGGSVSGGYVHAANIPLNDKVPDISGTVPPFDESKSKSDFPVVSIHSAQSLWNDMVTQSGAPFAPKQQASLKYYTTNAGYTNMNKYLRGYQGASAATQTHIANAQAGMRPLTRDVVLHRGQGSFTDAAGRHWSSYEEISQYVGTNLDQQAFFSASVGGKADFGGSIMMEIEAPAGTPAVYVKAFSAYKNSESEMLLAANMSYRILEVKKNGHQTVVRMRAVPKGSE